MQKLMAFSRKYPVLIILFLIAGSVFSAFYIGRIWIDTSVESLMLIGDPEKKYYTETVKLFGSDSIMIVFIQDDDLFTVRKLTKLDQLINDLNKIPDINRVESLFSVSNLKGSTGYISNQPLLDRVPESDQLAQKIMKEAISNPILLGNLISKDGKKTAINLYMNPTAERDKVSRQIIVKMLSEYVEKYKEHFDVIFEYGGPYTRNELSKLISGDMSTLFLLSIGILLLMLIITLKSLNGAILPLITSGFSILFTFGFMGFFRIPITLVTFIIPVLTIIIGSTEDIHILAEYTVGLRKERNRKLAVNHMINSIGTAILLTSITTFLGFLSISLNRIPALVQFGLTAGFALLINPLITAMLAPIYLSLFGRKGIRKTNRKYISILKKANDAIKKWYIHVIMNRNNILLTIFIISALLGIFFLLRVMVDNNLTNFFKQDSPVLVRKNKIHDELSGIRMFNIRLSSGAANVFKKPEYLQTISDIQQLINQVYSFDKSVSIADYLKLINKEMNYGQDLFYTIPDSEQLVDQYSIFLHRDEIRSFISSDWSEACILIRHNISSSHELKMIINRLNSDIAMILNKLKYKDDITDNIQFSDKTEQPEDEREAYDNLFDDNLFNELLETDIPDSNRLIKNEPVRLTHKLTGEDLLINRASDTYTQSQLLGIAVVLIAIFIIMSILFTNIKAGLISLVPNIIPIIFIYGIMGIFNIPLNVGTCMVAVAAIGIAVDDTIHMLTRFNSLMRKYQDKSRAIRAVMKVELKPIISTSIALTFGFSVSIFANVVPIIQFGIFCAIAMICALLSDLFLTPILLMHVHLINISEIMKLKLVSELKDSTLFTGMSSYQVKKFILLCKIDHKKAEDVIIREGDEDQLMYILLKGKVKVLKTKANKEKVVLDRLGVGDVFGEIALICRRPRSASVIAEEDSAYLTIDWNGFKRISKSSKSIAMKLYFNLANILGMRLAEVVDYLI